MFMLRPKKPLQKQFVRKLLVCLISVSLILAYLPETVSKAAIFGTQTYLFSTDFTNVQGNNQWYYMYSNGSSYNNMTWDTGLNEWVVSQTNCQISSYWMHPCFNEDAVIAWKAPRDGIICITANGGTIRSTTAGGDGVQVKVVKNSSNVWPASGWQSISSGTSVDFAPQYTAVAKGDMIYFVLNRNVGISYDTTVWDPSIVYTGNSFRFSGDFSNIQGQKQWYYMQWDGSSYSNMTWDTANSRWMGNQPYCLVTNAWLHPDMNDSVIAWKAPRDGTINIAAYSGTITNTITGGDGVKVKVLKNSSNVWPVSGWQNIAAGGSVAFPAETVAVAKDDMIYFVLNKNVNNSCDCTNWDPIIDYLPVSQPDVNPGFSDIYKYTSGYSSTQGQNQWYYMQWNGSSYINMNWDSANSQWYGNQQNILIGNGWAHPATDDAVIAWKAPKAGTVTIKCMIDHNSLSGDGVRYKIVKSGFTQIWPSSGWQELIPNLTVQSICQVTVAQNDYIYFHVNMNASNDYDLTVLDPAISYNDNPQYTLDKAEMVITKAQATSMGIDAFDASVSIVGNGANFDFYHTLSGAYTQKFQGTLDQPSQTLIYNKDAFTNPNNIEGQWWINNMYRDGDGGLLAFCHLEWCSNDGFWALGLAYSDDDGDTFTKLGKIATFNLPETEGTVNIFGLPYVIKDGYFYVYYGDRMAHYDIPYMGGFPAVCRAPVADVLNAAKNGTVTTWKKYYNGAWNEDGMGGRASSVMQASNQYLWLLHGDAAYSTSLGKYLMTGFNFGRGQGVFLEFSDDGVNFEFPSFIINSNDYKATTNVCAYETIISTDGIDNGVVGNSFYVYWNQRTAWDCYCNQLYRQEVTLNPAGFSTPSYDGTLDFNACDQGMRQWYYQELNGSMYTNMQEDNFNSRWMGILDNQTLIGENWQMPGTTTDSVRKWVATKAGTIKITANGGSVKVASGTGADGVKIKVLKNASNVWPSLGWETIAAGGSATFAEQTVTVAAGDAIYFIVNKNSNNSNDTTTWEPIIKYQ